MHYTIGEFAAMLGVTRDTLRLYEKYGIIKPTKDHSNNYRYFTDLDARNLLMSRWYRSMEIPLQEVALLTNDASLEQIIQKLSQTQVKLEQDLIKRKRILDKITEINNDFREIKNLLNQCCVKQVPGIYRLKQTNGDNLVNDPFLRGMVDTWMERLPFTFYSFRVDKGEMLMKEDRFIYNWGLAIAEDDLPILGLELNEHVEYIPQGKCISSIILVSDKEFIMRDSLQFMFDYLQEHQFSLCGDIIGKIILTEKIDEHKESYLEVNMPIQ